jgi:hypothetical protein
MAIEEVFSLLKIDFRRGGEHHHVSNGYVGIDCPGCSPNSGKYKLGIREGTTYATCWTCGRVDLARTLCEYSGERLGAILDLLRGCREAVVRKTTCTGKLEIPEGVRELLPAHRKYLKDQRGFDPEELERIWGIKGIGIDAKLPWRLWIPILLEDRVVSWTTRRITEQEPRYQNASPKQEAYPAKKVLYGEDFVRWSIVVTEGPFDAMRIGPGAVATLGLCYTATQLARVSRYPIRVVCFDNSPEAQSRAKKMCDDLSAFPGDTYQVNLDAPDPGSASKKEIKSLRKRFLR